MDAGVSHKLAGLDSTIKLYQLWSFMTLKIFFAHSLWQKNTLWWLNWLYGIDLFVWWCCNVLSNDGHRDDDAGVSHKLAGLDSTIKLYQLWSFMTSLKKNPIS